MRTTKRVLHIIADNTFGFSLLNLRVFDAITTTGGLIPLENVDWEIAKRLRGVLPDLLDAALALARRELTAYVSGGLTETEALQLIHDLGRSTSPEFRSGEVRTEFIEAAELSAQDRYFRKAWVCPPHLTGTPPTCHCDMVLARNVHMNQIRKVRDVELGKLDDPFMRALETANTLDQQRIAAQKQVLRDIPQTFDLSSYTTPAALKAAWPVELPARS